MPKSSMVSRLSRFFSWVRVSSAATGSSISALSVSSNSIQSVCAPQVVKEPRIRSISLGSRRSWADRLTEIGRSSPSSCQA
ncbi:hypothetical protein D3C86_1889960 [compost metagenome]